MQPSELVCRKNLEEFECAALVCCKQSFMGHLDGIVEDQVAEESQTLKTMLTGYPRRARTLLEFELEAIFLIF